MNCFVSVLYTLIGFASGIAVLLRALKFTSQTYSLFINIYQHSFFDLGTRWRLSVSFTLRPLYPQGKSPWYPLDRGLGEPQSRSGRGGEKKNSQPPPGIEH